MWTKIEQNKDCKRRESNFLGSRRPSAYLDSSTDGSEKLKLDPNTLSLFVTEELDYQFTLAELSTLLGGITARSSSEKKSGGISSDVLVCLTSSISMMHALSKDIIALLIKMLKLFPQAEDPMLTGKEIHSDSDSSENDIQDEQEHFIELCENIVNLLVVYEVFCNTQNGISNHELLPLYINQPQFKNIMIPRVRQSDEKSVGAFSELVLYVFLAVDRYQSIFCHLGEVIPSIVPLTEEVRTIQELIRPTRVKILHNAKLVSKILQIKSLPNSFELFPKERGFLKNSPVKKQRFARPSDKERMFYLFSDVLIYCTTNNQFKGMFFCSHLLVRDIPDNPTQFTLTYVKENALRQEEKIRYTITADSPVEKQDWLYQFNSVLPQEIDNRSPHINRKVRLTTLEETALKDIPDVVFTASQLPREYKDLSECLNSATVWNNPPRTPVEVSIGLLKQIMKIYSENRGLLERFGISGFGLISIHPSFQEFENASAELQQVNIKKMSTEDQTIFWINVYNTITLHGLIKQSNLVKNGIAAFQSNNKYYIGGHIFSLSIIEHAILRAQSHSPGFILSSRLYPKLKKTDPRYEFIVTESNPLINFALNIGSVNSPPIICYTPETWKEQLQQQARTFCRHHVRIFLHSNQRKVFLPKLLHLYWKDFGNSQREMLIFIRDKFLHPSQQQELSFLDDASVSISIKYDSPEWEFKYPIGKEEIAAEEAVPPNTILKEYVLLINQQHVYVQDTLSESEYAFMVPYQLLNLWQGARRNQWKDAEQAKKINSHAIHNYERLQSHMEMMDNSLKIYTQYVTRSGDYKGLTFRPSTYKKDPLLQFVAVNLQTQFTIISEDKSFSKIVATFAHVTFGAPVAHIYRFKNGNGLRQLKKLRNKLKKTLEQDISADLEKVSNELSDIETQFQLRLDVCVPSIISALVTAVAKMIQTYSSPFDELYFQQILHCGLLVQFESLLSTSGSEIGMIGDMDVAVQILKYFHIQFIPINESNKLNPTITFMEDFMTVDRTDDMQCFGFGDYLISWQVPFFQKLPLAIKQGELINIKPILFTQGINEKQSVAIRLGETKLQERINQENFVLLSEYFQNWVSFHKYHSQDTNFDPFYTYLQRIQKIIENSKCEKNVEILPRTADFTRILGGLRFTSCKSAKDRTSMSITWEQGRFLHTKAGLPSSNILKVANDMRSRGVRRENAFRNIGKQKFKFNSFQKSSLPKEYQLRKIA